jgi:PKD repeat protein
VTTTQRTVTADASASTDADGDALTYSWTWGDGTTSAGRVMSHTYAKPGEYTIELTVADGKASSETSKTVKVNNGPKVHSQGVGADAPGAGLVAALAALLAGFVVASRRRA